MKTIEEMVQQEISCCLSSLVSMLANGDAQAGTDLAELCDRALGLATPVPDYEEAAIQAGWSQAKADPHYFNIGKPGEPMLTVHAESWEALCNDHDIDPIETKVYEHWAVSPSLAERLLAQGEKVDTAFAGLNVWARTSKDQPIGSDGAIARIYAEMMKVHKHDDTPDYLRPLLDPPNE